ncbi:MAG: ATP synthase F1 subunit gamma [Intestinimonas sp.]|jgi:F-type H+-transporting ATPase subunit gamma|nr:ATP synthase F1 subunit gamma [Intestinimonas sp.]
MANMQEIRAHIRSVQETRKITNAMYLISSNHLQKARKQLNDVKPYFETVESTITDILHRSPDLPHPYLDSRTKPRPQNRTVGYVVITGDKGLAGAYNRNVLKLAESAAAAAPNCRLFLVGQVGVAWFREQNVPIEREFEYSAQNPNLHRAREIGRFLVEEFRQKRLDELQVIYTEMVTPLKLEPKTVKLLPLDRNVFPWKPRSGEGRQPVNYVPSEAAVLSALAPHYVTGMIFSTLVESFCSEQQARMSAMDASTKAAGDLLRQLSLSYNRARQAAITQEITEVVGGAQAGGK